MQVFFFFIEIIKQGCVYLLIQNEVIIEQEYIWYMYIVRKCQMYLYRNRQKNEAFLQLVYIYFISIDIVRLFCYTPRNEVVGGYTGFTMSVRL